MPLVTDSIEIARPPEDVWRLLGTPERWTEGYLDTVQRSPDYPGPGTRNDHLYRTQRREEVEVRVTRSEAPTLLEEAQRGKTFSRELRYRLEPSGERTRLSVEDEISFIGLARMAAPFATPDVRRRWRRSLDRLRAEAERG
jgi:carbon monoxide dehydrogenase subunit G